MRWRLLLRALAAAGRASVLRLRLYTKGVGKSQKNGESARGAACLCCEVELLREASRGTQQEQRTGEKGIRTHARGRSLRANERGCGDRTKTKCDVAQVSELMGRFWWKR